MDEKMCDVEIKMTTIDEFEEEITKEYDKVEKFIKDKQAQHINNSLIVKELEEKEYFNVHYYTIKKICITYTHICMCMYIYIYIYDVYYSNY